MGYLSPRMLQCFGGPADGQLVEAHLNPEHIFVNGKLRFYDIRREDYTTSTIHQACYQATMLQIGAAGTFSSRMVLKHVPPAAMGSDDDGA